MIVLEYNLVPPDQPRCLHKLLQRDAILVEGQVISALCISSRTRRRSVGERMHFVLTEGFAGAQGEFKDMRQLIGAKAELVG